MSEEELTELREAVSDLEDFPHADLIVERAREYYERTPMAMSRAKAAALRDFLKRHGYRAIDMADLLGWTKGGMDKLMSDARNDVAESRHLLHMVSDGPVHVLAEFEVPHEGGSGNEKVAIGEYVLHGVEDEWDVPYVVFREQYATGADGLPTDHEAFAGTTVERYETADDLVDSCLAEADFPGAEAAWKAGLNEAGFDY